MEKLLDSSVLHHYTVRECLDNNVPAHIVAVAQLSEIDVKFLEEGVRRLEELLGEREDRIDKLKYELDLLRLNTEDNARDIKEDHEFEIASLEEKIQELERLLGALNDKHVGRDPCHIGAVGRGENG